MKIGVLMGGISSEREVSLHSGEGIVEYLDRNKYEVFPIVIDTKEGLIEKVKGMDFIFIALHGAFGEDGAVQAILESINMPYSGCGILTSALCMDKKQTKRILKSESIAVAPEVLVRRDKPFEGEKIKELGYPVVVKPNGGGSSVGTFLVKSDQELERAITEALKFDKEVIVERYLPGNEYTIPVLNGEVFPILSIKASGEFYDYNSKYTDGGSEKAIAELTEDLQKKMKEIGERCWDIFNCKAYVRIDIIVSDGIPYVLELNTLPGMTKNSLFPKSAKGVNMEYSELLDKIIEYSL